MKILFLAFFILHSSFFIPKAYAQGISLSLYPPIFQIDATPPADIQAPLSIQNNEDSEVNLSISLKPFAPSDQENGQVDYIVPSQTNFTDPLILQRVKVIDPSGSNQEILNLTLAPGQKKDLKVLIQLPKDEPPSDYYFSILFQSGTSSSPSNSSQTQAGIASNVLLSIGPKGKIDGSIQEFSTPLFLDKGPVPFTVRVKNKNTFYTTVFGDILIKNMFGQTVGRLDLPKTNVLAHSVRQISTLESKGQSADWNEKFLLGPYKATLTLALSDSGPIFRRDIYFFAFPVNILLLIIAVLLVLIYITVKVRSKI